MIQSEGKPLEPTCACTEHVGDLLEAGVSTVWPVRKEGDRVKIFINTDPHTVKAFWACSRDDIFNLAGDSPEGYDLFTCIGGDLSTMSSVGPGSFIIKGGEYFFTQPKSGASG